MLTWSANAREHNSTPPLILQGVGKRKRRINRGAKKEIKGQ
jgi:hypothetical protein